MIYDDLQLFKRLASAKMKSETMKQEKEAQQLINVKNIW